MCDKLNTSIIRLDLIGYRLEVHYNEQIGFLGIKVHGETVLNIESSGPNLPLSIALYDAPGEPKHKMDIQPR